jgi:UDP-N-acetylglucosamine:LPS N-acetylglucosamine transferase
LYDAMAAVEARSGGRLRRFGFTDRVADLMAACDVLLTKPGPGSLAEALHMQVPVVVCGNQRTIPQERFNVRLVEREGWGLAAADWHGMAHALGELARDPRRLDRMREAVAHRPPNLAVYEVLDIIEGVAGAGRASAPGAA